MVKSVNLFHNNKIYKLLKMEVGSIRLYFSSLTKGTEYFFNNSEIKAWSKAIPFFFKNEIIKLQIPATIAVAWLVPVNGSDIQFFYKTQYQNHKHK